MRKSILFVDDERQILKALNRLFIDTEYSISIAENGEEALEILEREKIDMIISDMRMPNMDGYQLLKKVKTAYPQVSRIVLSGYADENLVFKILQNNLAKLYLLKPWDNQKFIGIINQVFEVEAMVKNDEVLRVINNLEEIPTLPSLYNKICSLIDKDVDMKTISRAIEEDPAIASKILHIANSGYYGARTGSIMQSILYLGLTNIKNIVLTTSVFDNLKMNSVLFDKDLLWNHSCICNKMVNFLYEKVFGKKLHDTYMSAGLLHDIGEIVLLSNFGKQYKNVLKIINDNEDISINEAECKMMSISHQEIGGYILNWWDFPQPIVESTLFHHDPLNKRIINKELVCIVHLADWHSWNILGKSKYSKLNKETFGFLNITEESFNQLVSEFSMD